MEPNYNVEEFIPSGLRFLNRQDQVVHFVHYSQLRAMVRYDEDCRKGKITADSAQPCGYPEFIRCINEDPDCPQKFCEVDLATGTIIPCGIPIKNVDKFAPRPKYQKTEDEVREDRVWKGGAMMYLEEAQRRAQYQQKKTEECRSNKRELKEEGGSQGKKLRVEEEVPKKSVAGSEGAPLTISFKPSKSSSRASKFAKPVKKASTSRREDGDIVMSTTATTSRANTSSGATSVGSSSSSKGSGDMQEELIEYVDTVGVEASK